jgi:hypothetical protein
MHKAAALEQADDHKGIELRNSMAGAWAEIPLFLLFSIR